MANIDGNCYDSRFTKIHSGDQRVDLAAPSIRTKDSASLPEEKYRGSFIFVTLATLQTFIAIFEAVGFAGAVGWTSPGAVASRAFRFDAAQQVIQSATRWEFPCDLVYVPGIATPV